MEKDYSNLHRKLVLKYFWKVMKRYKVSFFTVVTLTIIACLFDIYIPLQYLKLWNVLSANSFTVVDSAKSIVLLILALNIIRWIIRRTSRFLHVYFEAEVIQGLRSQAFSYMIGHSHSFFANNFSGSLVRKINKYANAFEHLDDKLISDVLPLIVRGVGTVVVVYTLLPKYSYILGIFCLVFLLTVFIFTRYKLKYDVIASEWDTKTTGALADSVGNYSSIQLFTGHSYETSRVGKVLEEQKKQPNSIGTYGRHFQLLEVSILF